MQANAIYRPAGNNGIHDVQSTVSRIGIQPCECTGDVNDDDVVDVDDLVGVILNWGVECPQWPAATEMGNE